MPGDTSRIEELRRRVEKDPASIVFAQLAEEHRRAGNPDEAVRVCRAGLVQHPNYISARVTLGRALMELNQLEDAQAEFEQVLLVAPDNLVAVRSMAELYQLKGEVPPDFSGPQYAEHAATPPLPLPEIAPAPVVPPPLPDAAFSVAPPPEIAFTPPPAPEPESVAPIPEPTAAPPMPAQPIIDIFGEAPRTTPVDDMFDAPAPAPASSMDDLFGVPSTPSSTVDDIFGSPAAADADEDIPLDLDAALAEEPEVASPEPTAPEEAPKPEPPGLDLDAAVAAFNEAFGVPAAVEPEPARAPEPEPAAEPAVSQLEQWLDSIATDRDRRRSP